MEIEKLLEDKKTRDKIQDEKRIESAVISIIIIIFAMFMVTRL